MNQAGSSYGAGRGEGIPTCPRHPDTYAAVRCQRCGRPACGQCQVQAPVGIQCVDCVKETSRRTPRTRNAFGLRARGSKPVVTYALIGIFAVVYLVQQADAGLMRQLWFSAVDGYFEPWRFITSSVVHANLTHLAFNALALFIVGRVLEPVVGSLRFLGTFIVGSVGGSLAVLLLSGGPAQMAFLTPVVGASGAVLCLFGAILPLMVKAGQQVQGLVVILVLNIVIGFLPGFNISWQGHLGGMIVGLILGALWMVVPARRRGIVTTTSILLALPILAGIAYAYYGMYT